VFLRGLLRGFSRRGFPRTCSRGRPGTTRRFHGRFRAYGYSMFRAAGKSPDAVERVRIPGRLRRRVPAADAGASDRPARGFRPLLDVGGGRSADHRCADGAGLPHRGGAETRRRAGGAGPVFGGPPAGGGAAGLGGRPGGLLLGARPRGNREGDPDAKAKGTVIPPGVDDRFRRLPRGRSPAPTSACPRMRTSSSSQRAGRGEEHGRGRGCVPPDPGTVGEAPDPRRRGQGGPEDDGGGVAFLPSVPHDAMPMLYAAADAVICPSRYESFGLVTLEALASGVPVAVPQGTYWGGRSGRRAGASRTTRAIPEGCPGRCSRCCPTRRCGPACPGKGSASRRRSRGRRVRSRGRKLLSSFSTSRSPR